MSIHNAILEKLRDALIKDLITDIPTSDTARAGSVKIGPFQGDPTPDEGRITISVHENDPDRIAKGGVTGMNDEWSDDAEMIEVGGAATMNRRFTVKARCLFSNTREDEDEARSIASIVRSRLERSLMRISFAGVTSGTEYVSRGVLSPDVSGEMLQAGGPPDAYDYIIRLHFSVLTTRTGVFS